MFKDSFYYLNDEYYDIVYYCDDGVIIISTDARLASISDLDKKKRLLKKKKF